MEKKEIQLRKTGRGRPDLFPSSCSFPPLFPQNGLTCQIEPRSQELCVFFCAGVEDLGCFLPLSQAR